MTPEIYPGIEKAVKLTPDLIESLVIENYLLITGIGTTPEALKSKCRQQKTIIRPRMIILYLLRELTDLTLTELGMLYARLDHASVIHTYKVMKNEITTYPKGELTAVYLKTKTQIYNMLEKGELIR